MDDLLEQFIREECSADVRRMLHDALADRAATYAHFDFNRFEITIDRAQDVVVLADVLDATPAGVQRVPIDAFVEALRRA